MGKRFNTYGPNRTDGMALIGRTAEYPFRVRWPVRLIQLCGGRRWSLNVCIFETPEAERVSETNQDEEIENEKENR
ncbi:MAG TPA: hypothetical protein VIS29_08920 [Streptomyces sp.]|jgi:hypothetical protein